MMVNLFSLKVFSSIYRYTVAVWTQKQFILLLTHPQGSQGCLKMCQDPLNLNLDIWCANMDPKSLSNLRDILVDGYYGRFTYNHQIDIP